MDGFRVCVRETVLGFTFWCLFQALAPMIWFYPLNELEISGYEAFAVFLFSPLLLSIGPLWRLCQTPVVTAMLRLASVAALASFQAPDTLSRLVTLSLGCACAMLLLTVTLWGRPRQRAETCWGLLLGLMAFISSRVWFTSFVPTWWSARTNSLVIALAVVATLDKITSDHQSPEQQQREKPRSKGCVVTPNWVLAGLGFGSWLFLSQWVFGEVSLLARWTVKGYPETGPTPYPWGAAVLLCLWLGTELSICHRLVRSPIWWAVGAVAMATLYYLDTWQAFAGGLVLAVYTMSIWPEMVDRVTLCPPVKTLTLALGVWLVQVLFSVWTVAYNFVPGGEFTREHSDWLSAAVMICIGAAILTGKPGPEQKSHSAFIEYGTPAKTAPSTQTSLVLLLIVMIGLGGFAARFPRQQFSRPDKDTFTAAIWTYHFGYDNKGWPSLERGAQLINDSGADVITLLESDASKPFLGNNDLGQWLGERLGMYVDFGPSTRDHTWGNLILSKYPFVKSKHHLLPSPMGELAPAVTATVNVTGRLVDLVVTHMGNDRDVMDRDLQARHLAGELKQAENPVIFLGYVTSAPFSRDYMELTQKGHVQDIDATDKERWCEYIMYRGLQRLGYARVSHAGLSDTELQMAKFRIPKDGEELQDNSRVVTDPDKVSKEVHFSSRFGSFKQGHNWAPEHQYHMSTPKYFIP